MEGRSSLKRGANRQTGHAPGASGRDTKFRRAANILHWTPTPPSRWQYRPDVTTPLLRRVSISYRRKGTRWACDGVCGFPRRRIFLRRFASKAFSDAPQILVMRSHQPGSDRAHDRAHSDHSFVAGGVSHETIMRCVHVRVPGKVFTTAGKADARRS